MLFSDKKSQLEKKKTKGYKNTSFLWEVIVVSYKIKLLKIFKRM